MTSVMPKLPFKIVDTYISLSESVAIRNNDRMKFKPHWKHKPGK